MALRAAHTSGNRTSIAPGFAVASALAGLNLYWSEPQEPPLLEWEKWLELITVAMMAKRSIYLSELTRVERSERVSAIMDGFSEEAASKKVFGILFLSIGQAARKTLLDKIPATQNAAITLLFSWMGVEKPSL